MHILGISCYYHDAAAAILRDGQLVAAAEEERFSRVKHDFGFPKHAIEFCLREAKIDAKDVDYVVFYERPFRKLDRLLISVLQTYPQSWKVFRESMIGWMLDKLWIASTLQSELGVSRDRVLFSEHHLSHAASAFLCSPFEESAILTVDGGLRRGARYANPVDQANRVSAFHWAALQRIHGVPRLRGERRRIQSDGHGALRDAALRGQSVEDGEAERRRFFFAGHGLLLLPLRDRPHVHAEAGGTFRRAAAAGDALFHGVDGVPEIFWQKAGGLYCAMPGE